MKEKISVAVMAWNERESVDGVARAAHATLSRTGHPFELLLIDDGSSDGTGEACDRVSAELAEVRVVHHAGNLGLGGVYRTGFSAYRGDLLTFLPADGQFPADTITRLLAGIAGHDMALGYLDQRERPWLGRLLSLVERGLFRALLGPLPRFQGMFMVRRRVLEELPLGSRGRGWGIVMELLLRASRGPYRIASVATELLPRANGRSKVNNLPTIWANTRQLLALRRILRDAPAAAAAPAEIP